MEVKEFHEKTLKIFFGKPIIAYSIEATGAELGASATNKYLAFAARNFNGDNVADNETAYGYLRKVKVTVIDGVIGGDGSFAEGGFGEGDGTGMVPVAGSSNIRSVIIFSIRERNALAPVPFSAAFFAKS